MNITPKVQLTTSIDNADELINISVSNVTQYFNVTLLQSESIVDVTNDIVRKEGKYTITISVKLIDDSIAYSKFTVILYDTLLINNIKSVIDNVTDEMINNNTDIQYITDSIVVTTQDNIVVPISKDISRDIKETTVSYYVSVIVYPNTNRSYKYISDYYNKYNYIEQIVNVPKILLSITNQYYGAFRIEAVSLPSDVKVFINGNTSDVAIPQYIVEDKNSFLFNSSINTVPSSPVNDVLYATVVKDTKHITTRVISYDYTEVYNDSNTYIVQYTVKPITDMPNVLEFNQKVIDVDITNNNTFNFLVLGYNRDVVSNVHAIENIISSDSNTSRVFDMSDVPTTVLSYYDNSYSSYMKFIQVHSNVYDYNYKIECSVNGVSVLNVQPNSQLPLPTSSEYTLSNDNKDVVFNDINYIIDLPTVDGLIIRSQANYSLSTEDDRSVLVAFDCITQELLSHEYGGNHIPNYYRVDPTDNSDLYYTVLVQPLFNTAIITSLDILANDTVLIRGVDYTFVPVSSKYCYNNLYDLKIKHSAVMSIIGSNTVVKLSIMVNSISNSNTAVKAVESFINVAVSTTPMKCASLDVVECEFNGNKVLANASPLVPYVKGYKFTNPVFTYIPRLHNSDISVLIHLGDVNSNYYGSEFKQLDTVYESTGIYDVLSDVNGKVLGVGLDKVSLPNIWNIPIDIKNTIPTQYETIVLPSTCNIDSLATTTTVGDDIIIKELNDGEVFDATTLLTINTNGVDSSITNLQLVTSSGGDATGIMYSALASEDNDVFIGFKALFSLSTNTDSSFKYITNNTLVDSNGSNVVVKITKAQSIGEYSSSDITGIINLKINDGNPIIYDVLPDYVASNITELSDTSNSKYMLVNSDYDVLYYPYEVNYDVLYKNSSNGQYSLEVAFDNTILKTTDSKLVHLYNNDNGAMIMLNGINIMSYTSSDAYLSYSSTEYSNSNGLSFNLMTLPIGAPSELDLDNQKLLCKITTEYNDELASFEVSQLKLSTDYNIKIDRSTFEFVTGNYYYVKLSYGRTLSEFYDTPSSISKVYMEYTVHIV